MAWLAHESPKDRQRQKALELLAESSMLLCNTLKNLCGLRVSTTADEWEGWITPAFLRPSKLFCRDRYRN